MALVTASAKALLDVFVEFGSKGLLSKEKAVDQERLDVLVAAPLEKSPKVKIKEWIREYKNLYIKGLCNAIITSHSSQILVIRHFLHFKQNELFSKLSIELKEYGL